MHGTRGAKVFGVAVAAAAFLGACSNAGTTASSATVTKAGPPTEPSTSSAATSAPVTTSTTPSTSTIPTTTLPPVKVALLTAAEVQALVGIPMKTADGCVDSHLCAIDSADSTKFGKARIKAVQVTCASVGDAAAARAWLERGATPSPLADVAGIGEFAVSFGVKDGSNRTHYAGGFFQHGQACIVSTVEDPYTQDAPDLATEKSIVDALAGLAAKRL